MNPDNGSRAGAVTSRIEALRRARGGERVSFNEVADHLADFVQRRPTAAETIGELALFLRAVEHADHAHAGGGSSSLEYDDT